MSPAEHTVNALGVLCPVPIIRLARAAAALPPGTVLELLTDDPAAEHDVPAWCRLRGHELLDTTTLSAMQVPEAGATAPGPTAPGGSARADATGPVEATREPYVPNPAPGQALRHLIRLAGPLESDSGPR